MQAFYEFFEPIIISTPTLSTGSPYTDLTFTQNNTSAIVRFKNGNLSSQGQKIKSTQNFITNNTIIWCCFDIKDKANLSLECIIIWNNQRYKIIEIKIQQYVIQNIIVLAEYINEGNIY